MPQFKFNTISRTEIERSHGGNVMIQAIDDDGDDHQLVTGMPGSGKTTVTIMRAERLINANKTIKVFTLQNLLTISLKNISSQSLKHKIFGFYRWYVSKIRHFEDTEEQMISNMKAEPIIDEILIDEGQDFERKIYRTLIPKCKRMTVGADNAQRVHENGILSDEIKQELENNKSVISIRLEYNYRNTFEIYNFARYFVPDNEKANKQFSLDKMPKGNGNKPELIQVLTDDMKFNRIKVLLENAGERNIAILLFHQNEVDRYHEKLQEMGYKCTKHHYNSPVDNEIENILITTYKAAKGLEFQVVIMPDMHLAMNKDYQTQEHYYIGCTRATENLYLIYTGLKLPGCFEKFDKNSYEYQAYETEHQKILNQKIPQMTDLSKFTKK